MESSANGAGALGERSAGGLGWGAGRALGGRGGARGAAAVWGASDAAWPTAN
jgi:hypothetical protein